MLARPLNRVFNVSSILITAISFSIVFQDEEGHTLCFFSCSGFTSYCQLILDFFFLLMTGKITLVCAADLGSQVHLECKRLQLY